VGCGEGLSPSPLGRSLYPLPRKFFYIGTGGLGAFCVLFFPLQLPVLQAKTDDLGPWAWKTSHTLCTCNISNRECGRRGGEATKEVGGRPTSCSRKLLRLASRVAAAYG